MMSASLTFVSQVERTVHAVSASPYGVLVLATAMVAAATVVVADAVVVAVPSRHRHLVEWALKVC